MGEAVTELGVASGIEEVGIELVRGSAKKLTQYLEGNLQSLVKINNLRQYSFIMYIMTIPGIQN